MQKIVIIVIIYFDNLKKKLKFYESCNASIITNVTTESIEADVSYKQSKTLTST